MPLPPMRYVMFTATPNTLFQLDPKAWEFIKSWVFSREAKALINFNNPIFSRGDPNLSNCLWDNGRLRFVDFEYAGWSDKAFDLADLVEHINKGLYKSDEGSAAADPFGLFT